MNSKDRHYTIDLGSMTHDDYVAFARLGGRGREQLKKWAADAALAGDMGGTLRLFEAINATGPDPEFALGLAQDLKRRGRPEDASKVIAAALETAPNNPALLIEGAAVSLARGDISGMMRLGSEAIKCTPQSVTIICEFSSLLREAGKIESALGLLGASVDALGPHPEFLGRIRGILTDNQVMPQPGLSQTLIEAALRKAVKVPEIEALVQSLGARLGGSGEISANPAPIRAEEEVVAFKIVEFLQGGGSQTLDRSDASEIERLVASAEASGLLRELKNKATQASATALLQAVLCRLTSTGAASPDEFVELSHLFMNPPAGSQAPSKMAHMEVLDLSLLFHPDSALLWAERAKAWLKLGDITAARQDSDVAFDLSPSVAGIVGLHADILWVCDDREAAKNVLRQFLAQVGEDAGLALKSAKFACWSDEHADAEPILRRLAARMDSGPEEISLFASVLVRLGSAAEAEAVLMKAIGEAPHPELHAALAAVSTTLTWSTFPDYVDDKRLERLEQSLKAAGSLLVDHNLLWDAIRLFIALKREESCFFWLETALSNGSHGNQRPEACWHVLARLLKQSDISADLRASPSGLARELTRQGLAYLATQRLFEAMISLRIAYQFDPQEHAARYNAGFIALSQGNVAHAARLFQPLERIYAEDMERVAWPATEGIAWPWRTFRLQNAFMDDGQMQESWPRITVITPSYGQGSYIEETILSIINQEYPNLQYIVVDGLSQDETPRVLERYRNHIDHLIIERDNGQTDAINKGLRLATGELITWVNSDDMLAPGALFKLAETYRMTHADIIFGSCLAHSDRQFSIANLPTVRQETFTTQHLADIFNFWMKGFFFYQPEVIFTRRLLDKVGGQLDETLYFTMDYDFWMKCALTRPRIEAVHWPIALFRQHAEQKTANLLDCVIEQADVRDQVIPFEPVPERQRAIKKSINAALARRLPRIGVVSSRLSKIFSEDAADDLLTYFAHRKMHVELVEDASQLKGPTHLLIKLIHLQGDEQDIANFRATNPISPVVGWFWDNHHHLTANHEVATKLDVVIAGHRFASAYLRNEHALQLQSAPLCVTQWSAREAQELYYRFGSSQRSDDLYGGFVRYAFAGKRNRMIEELVASGDQGVYFLEENHLQRYFGMSVEQRFSEWARHKVSLCLPLRKDLSQRVFDALLTGQVPIVAPDIADLDEVLSQAEREALAIVTMKDYSISAVHAAHREALQRFKNGGPEAALARHQFALQRHTFPARVSDLIERLRLETGEI